VTTSLHVSALLLDMDGTLVDSTAVVERTWGEWALAHNLDPATVMTVIHGRQGHESMALLLPGRPMAENLADNDRMLRLETVRVDGIVPIAGAPQFLASLDGIPHALVTSATISLARARMGAAGLGMPPIIVTADDVVASKPDPEGFLAAAAALGVPPEACVVFEDSEAGILAARAAGMRVIGVGSAAVPFGADWTVPDLAGVRVTAEGLGARIELTPSPSQRASEGCSYFTPPSAIDHR
jgi:sugar-phosphatase